MKSRPGAGTQVELWLPVASAGQLEGAAGEASDGPAGAARRLLILAVDDDSLVLTNTAAMLDDLGHEVLVASSGKEALEVLKGRPEIDLVITDEVMPGMTGSQVGEAVRAMNPATPVIITSGFADLAAKVTGADFPRLSKPFGQSDLAAIVHETLEAVAAT